MVLTRMETMYLASDLLPKCSSIQKTITFCSAQRPLLSEVSVRKRPLLHRLEVFIVRRIFAVAIPLLCAYRSGPERTPERPAQALIQTIPIIWASTFMG